MFIQEKISEFTGNFIGLLRSGISFKKNKIDNQKAKDSFNTLRKTGTFDSENYFVSEETKNKMRFDKYEKTVDRDEINVVDMLKLERELTKLKKYNEYPIDTIEDEKVFSISSNSGIIDSFFVPDNENLHSKEWTSFVFKRRRDEIIFRENNKSV